MSRVSKIRQLDLEKEVMELRQKGLGPVTIANTLNERHKLDGPNRIIFSNVTNYLKSIPAAEMNVLKEQHLKEVILEPAMMLKTDLEEFREPIVNKIKNILSSNSNVLSKTEIMSLTAFVDFYKNIFDRIAKLENILSPGEHIKAEKVMIIKQYNDIKQVVMDTVMQCPNCSKILQDKLSTVVDVDENMQ